MIYLDHHAATPLCAAAAQTMADVLPHCFANPSSVHRAGRAAKKVVERARDQVAAALGTEPVNLTFTSGGTEACNLGIFGLARGVATRVVSSTIEHPAVHDAVARLEAEGCDVIRLAPTDLTPARLASLCDEQTLLAFQAVNHEVGLVFDVPALAQAARAQGARVFVDACQALGKLPLAALGVGDVDAMAVASHKIGGPAGAAALYLRRDVDIPPLFAGGSQERGRRPGSPDPVALAGFGAACGEVSQRLDKQPSIAALRDVLEDALVALGAKVNGVDVAAPLGRVSTCVNVSVPGARGEILVAALDVEGLCASAGSACSAGIAEPSPTLEALYGEQSWRASSALRLSLGPETTEDEVQEAVTILRRVLPRFRS